MATTTREAITFLLANAEMFSAAVNKKGEVDVEALAAQLETAAVRGDALGIIEKKTTFSSDVPEASDENENPQSAQGIFCDMIFSLAAEFKAGVKESGTSKDRRIGLDTPAGRFECVLKAPTKSE